eukprot:14627800-Alexandrium_andersonii.AAC.1
MLLKAWLYPVLRDEEPAFVGTADSAAQILNLGSNFASTFNRDRAPNFTWRSYLVATPEEVASELRWGASRPGVKARHQQVDPYHDPPGSALATLSLDERRRFDEYMSRWPDEAANLGQDVAWAQRTRGDVLHTVIKNGGIVMLPARDFASKADIRW